MIVYVPDYYKEFRCIADQCRHTCCKGWEVEIDEESMERFSSLPDIARHIESTEDDHFKLSEDEICPFLNPDGLCDMILKYGEDMLCQTCTDHPRFRNFWSDRLEMGLGLVCEEAARIVLSQKEPAKLIALSDDGEPSEKMDEDEKWLFQLRSDLIKDVRETGPLARYREYLLFRHIADALYDDRVEERIAFVDRLVMMAKDKWQETSGSIEELIEIVRCLSYDIEYDEEEKEKYLSGDK